MAETIKLFADFDDAGRLIIERQDGKPISIITHEEMAGECIEVLEFGTSGHAVKAMQALLNLHNAHLDEDGIFGNCTQTALIIFQDEHKLNASGVCDLLTWEALIRGKTNEN